MSCVELTKGLAEQIGLDEELHERVVAGVTGMARKWESEGGTFCCWSDRNWWCNVVERGYEEGGLHYRTVDAVFRDNRGTVMLLGIVNGRIEWDEDGLAAYLIEWDMLE